MKMLHTLVWFSLFWLFLLLTGLYFIAILPLFLPFLSPYQERAVGFLARMWGWFTVVTAGARVEVIGEENIPKDSQFCVVANHQSNFDIPVTLMVFPVTLGFIAKAELAKIPIMGFWMKKIGCIFLDRSNRRQAREAITEGAQNIRDGHAMVIFPEGTRSKGGKIAAFKPGSLKLPILSQTKIIPVTIDGTAQIYECNGNRIVPHLVRYTIHPAIDLQGVTPDMSRELAQQLSVIISQPLDIEQ